MPSYVDNSYSAACEDSDCHHPDDIEILGIFCSCDDDCDDRFFCCFGFNEHCVGTGLDNITIHQYYTDYPF